MLCSCVQSALKFSAVRGTISDRNSQIIRPSSTPLNSTSIKTIGFSVKPKPGVGSVNFRYSFFAYETERRPTQAAGNAFRANSERRCDIPGIIYYYLLLD